MTLTGERRERLEEAMWAVGLLGGVVLGLLIGHGLWLPGALFGGLLGWGVGVWHTERRKQEERRSTYQDQGAPGATSARRAPSEYVGSDRLRALEIRLLAELDDIQRRLDRLDARLAAAGGIAAAVQPGDTVAPRTAPQGETTATPDVGPAQPDIDTPEPLGLREAEHLASAARAALAAPAGPVETAPHAAETADALDLVSIPAAEPHTAESLPRPLITPIEPPSPPPTTPGGWLASLPGTVWRWFTDGNTMVRIGVVILFFGVAFLLRYLYEHIQVRIELRLAGVALGAVVMLAFGWRLRARRSGYALTLQAGGIGVLYLTIFAAFRLYNVLPPAVAFALLAAVAAGSAALAVLQDSRSFAVLGATGGFLAPVLASTGGGSHVTLFSYYAVLNAGILAIAWFKAWRLLNVVGFGFTFVIAAAWGAQYYRPAHFATTEPFLVLFFLFYVAIPLLFARREAPQLRHYVDGTLIFGVPLVGFGLQAALVQGIEYGAALSALALAAFYLALAALIHRRAGDRLRMLAEAFLALGVVFGTLAIPLALDGRWASTAWALEGAAIVWVGVRQRRIGARVFGMLLQIGAGGVFLADVDRQEQAIPFVNSFYLGSLFVAAAAFFTAWYLERRREDVAAAEQGVARAFFIWGIAWWAIGGLREIDQHVLPDYRVQGALLYFTVSSLAFSLVARRWEWPIARYPALALLPIMVIAAALGYARDAHPFAYIGYIVWPLAFATHFVLLRRHDTAESRYLYWAHAVGLWLLAALGTLEVAWGIDTLVAGKAAWPSVAWGLVPGVLLFALTRLARREAWAIGFHNESYFVAGAVPIATFLLLWTVWASLTKSGDPSPLPYVPVLNPLGLAQIGAVLAVALWFSAGRQLAYPFFAERSPALLYGVFAGAAFGWVNTELMRTVHHWGGVPYRLHDLLQSDLTQAGFAILWTVIALGAMVWATRAAVRPAWMSGATLMAVVVAKLFLIDLSSIGTVARIVSFIGVGVLMLLIGYFSPVPPRMRTEVT